MKTYLHFECTEKKKDREKNLGKKEKGPNMLSNTIKKEKNKKDEIIYMKFW